MMLVYVTKENLTVISMLHPGEGDSAEVALAEA